MTDREGEARRICLVCGRVLDWSQALGYHHGIASGPEELDHPAIPVSPTEAPEQLRERCDFCFADETVYVVPAKSFVTPYAPSMMVGDWAACELCGREIEKDAWNVVFRRSKAGYEARNGPMDSMTEMALKKMHRELRKNITGPIYRGKPQD